MLLQITNRTVICAALLVAYASFLQSKGLVSADQAILIIVLGFSYLSILSIFMLEKIMNGNPKNMMLIILVSAGVGCVVASLVCPLAVPILVGVLSHLYYTVVNGITVVLPSKPDDSQEEVVKMPPFYSREYESLINYIDEYSVMGLTETFVYDYDSIMKQYHSGKMQSNIVVESLHEIMENMEDVLNLIDKSKSKEYSDDIEVLQKLVVLCDKRIKEVQ